MSVPMCHRCTAITRRGKRCTRQTCHTGYCTQHLRLIEGLTIQPSHLSGAGWGLFAARNFKKNETVALYTGVISTVPIEGDYVLQVNSKRYIDAKKTSSSAGRYANDCLSSNQRQGECAGNNVFYESQNGRAFLKAKKAIHAGDEVMPSYSRGYWEEEPVD